jgi:hypothetical protein
MTHHSWDVVQEARIALAPGLGLANALVPGYRAENLLASGFGLGSAISPFSPPVNGEWVWENVELKEFVSRLNLTYGLAAPTITHRDPSFRSFILSTKERTNTTPAILMTKGVYDGFRKADPQRDSIQRGLWKPISLFVPGYTGGVYGGDVTFSS